MKAILDNGTVLEGTPEEIAEFNAIREHATSNGTARRIGDPSSGGVVRSLVWTEARARAFWNWVDGDQKKLLRFMLKRGGRATLDELKHHLEKKTGSGVAGVLANISRNARRETGYSKALVVDWVNNGKGWSYEIATEVLELFKRLGLE